MQWSEYTTAERLKTLRSGMTQEQLAEAAQVSVGVVRKLERGGTASLPSLLAIASALGTDIAVLLGQQAPRRSMDRDERAALRILSAATHDAAIGIPAAAEPGTVAELRTVVKRADAAYWAGRYAELGTVLAALLPEARARYDAAGNDEKEAAAGVLADVFQTAGMAANVWGSRDLAYAALTYGRQIAVQAGDDLREAHLAATTAWVNLRDGRTAQGFALAAAQANRIEPRMSEHDPDRLSVYGQLVTNAAVAASRGGASADTAREYLSQAHAVGARLGGEYARGGPCPAVRPAVRRHAGHEHRRRPGRYGGGVAAHGHHQAGRDGSPRDARPLRTRCRPDPCGVPPVGAGGRHPGGGLHHGAGVGAAPDVARSDHLAAGGCVRGPTSRARARGRRPAGRALTAHDHDPW